MANRTVKDAKSIKGTNPQYLVEKIIRSRIYDSKYWKEECFALTAELLVDKAMELKYIGGVFGGNIKPTPFICLVLKMLQIQPEKDIVVEFIKNEEFKYVRLLGALYMRLVGTALDVYKYLEPLLNDYRKVRRQNRQGDYELVHVDEYVDELLRDERSCDIILPRLQKRHILEDSSQIEPRVSALEDDVDDADDSSSSSDAGEDNEETHQKSASAARASKTLSSRHRSKHDDDDRHKRRTSPELSRKRQRSRSRSRERQSSNHDHNRRRNTTESSRKRHRSRSRERLSLNRDRSRRNKSPSPSSRHKERSKDTDRRREKEKRSRGGGSSEQNEIDEANALRAKLGLPPLRP